MRRNAIWPLSLMALFVVGTPPLAVPSVFTEDEKQSDPDSNQPADTRTTDANWKNTWRDPDRLIIEGAKHFDPHQIHDKLLADLDVIEARHPLAPREDYLRVLADRCRAGYLHAGFGNAKVVGHIDDADTSVKLTVDEGQQYVCGDIVVEGAANIDSRELVKWLTTKQPPPDSIFTGDIASEDVPAKQWVSDQGSPIEFAPPAWEIAGAAHFDELDQNQLRQRCSHAFAEAGFPWVKFEIQTQTDNKLHLAKLVIKILDEGAPAKIGKIKIIGNQRDSDEDVIQYLGITPGTLIRESDRTALWYKLWMSGRFLKHDVELVPSDDTIQTVTMRIKLRDYSPVTALRKPLSPSEQALLKCRAWLLASKQRQDDWVFTACGDVNFTAVLSPRSGILISAHAHGKVEEDDDSQVRLPPWPEFVVMTQPGELLYANERIKNKLSIASAGSRRTVSINLQMKTQPDPQGPGKNFIFALGAGLNSSDANTASLISFHLSIAPVVMLSHLYDCESDCQLEDNTLKVDSQQGLTFQVDTNTGRLLQCRYCRDNRAAITWEFSVEPDGFARVFAATNQRLDGRLTATANEYDSQRCWGSIANVLLDESMVPLLSSSWQPDEKQLSRLTKGVRALRAAVSHGLLQPIDDYISRADSGSKDEKEISNPAFVIPSIPASSGNEIWDAIKEPLSAVLHVMAFEELPEHFWAAIILRELEYGCLGKTKYSANGLNQLSNIGDFGPIAHLAVAEVLKNWYPEAARHIAQDELKILSGPLRASVAKAFTADVQLFLRPETISGKFLIHLATVLRQLSDEEAKDLGDLFLGEKGFILADVARWLHEYRNQPVEEVLPLVMPTVWNLGIGNMVENRLQQLAGESVAHKPDEAKRE